MIFIIFLHNLKTVYKSRYASGRRFYFVLTAREVISKSITHTHGIVHTAPRHVIVMSILYTSMIIYRLRYICDRVYFILWTSYRKHNNMQCVPFRRAVFVCFKPSAARKIDRFRIYHTAPTSTADRNIFYVVPIYTRGILLFVYCTS